MMTLVLVILTLLLIIYVALQKRKRIHFPPGPFPWPFIGNQYHLKMLSQEFGGQQHAFLELCKRYSSDIISLRLGGNDIVVVSDRALIHEILHNENYDGRPWNEFIKIRNLGLKKGITMNDGEEWKQLRSWTVRTLRDVGFAKRKMGELLANELATILEKLKESSVHEIKLAISPAVINVLWKLLTGQQICNDTKLQQLIKLLERRAKAFDMAGGILSTLPWLRYIMPNASGYNILVSLNNELKNLLMATIDEHKQHYVEGAEEDFIDLFLREKMAQKITETDVSLFTDDNLLITLIDFFIAGTNNTTATLDFLFLHMIKHQDVQDILHREIDNVIGAERFPDLKDRPKMPFTEAILTECQRMWVVTPIIGPRRVLADTTLGGYTIPKNVIVLMNVFPNNMDPELYPDPTSFKPERFIKDGVYHSDDNIITFGKGKRRCPGEALARSAIFLLFIGVMQKYRLLPVPGEESINLEVNFGLTVSPRPYKALLVPR